MQESYANSDKQYKNSIEQVKDQAAQYSAANYNVQSGGNGAAGYHVNTSPAVQKQNAQQLNAFLQNALYDSSSNFNQQNARNMVANWYEMGSINQNDANNLLAKYGLLG